MLFTFLPNSCPDLSSCGEYLLQNLEFVKGMSSSKSEAICVFSEFVCLRNLPISCNTVAMLETSLHWMYYLIFWPKKLWPLRRNLFSIEIVDDHRVTKLLPAHRVVEVPVHHISCQKLLENRKQKVHVFEVFGRECVQEWDLWTIEWVSEIPFGW